MILQTKKRSKSLSFGLESPMHQSGKLNTQNLMYFNVLGAATDFCQISSKSINFWENGAVKTCFWPILEDSHAYRWGGR